MSLKKLKADKTFFASILLLVCAGFFIFSSASLGLLAREGASFTTVALKQAAIALGGLVVMIIISNIDFQRWRQWAFYIFIGAVIITGLVFVPHIGFAHGGARRWLLIGHFTVQPAELLKIAAVMYMAALLTSYKSRIKTFKYGIGPFLGVLGIVAVLLLKQPDNGTFLVIFFALLTMLIVAGAQWKHIGAVMLVCVLAIGILAYFRPYVAARFTTFLHPTADALGSGYQIQQALIAVGSGSITGRGFGQSIQKFNFLPEPIGDSIFAVAAEEFGFIGTTVIIGIFLFFTLRGLKIAAHSKDSFGGLLATGIVILIIAQALINIGSMLGILPLTGIPLSFVSQGGTALLFTLAEAGIILNISKYQRKSI